MKLNKKQTEIYDWLILNPGYFKKACDKAYSFSKFHNWDMFQEIYFIAKKDYKVNNPEYKKIVLKSFDEIFPWSINNTKRELIKLDNLKQFGTEYHPKDVAFKRNVFDVNNVLIIGDTHFPFCKKGYLEFCIETQKKYNCGTIVHIGDLVDNHAVSYHESDADGMSPGDEYKAALKECEDWYKAFPEVLICLGNHDRLPFRKAYTAGLPKNWLKSYQEMFNSPKGWKWDFVHKFNGVIYQHGTGMSGEMASINAARENRQSTVLGHMHTVCNTRFLASHKDIIFGMNVGCGIDHTKYAFAYGRENTRKPVLSCGVVLNGKMPINIPMNL